MKNKQSLPTDNFLNQNIYIVLNINQTNNTTYRLRNFYVFFVYM